MASSRCKDEAVPITDLVSPMNCNCRTDELVIDLHRLQGGEGDDCFLELGPVHYRPKEDHYRVEFTVADHCVEKARGVCENIAHLVHDEVDDNVGVFAFNQAGNPVAQFVE